MEILSLGEKIKKLRKEKNLTLKELAGDRITAAQISHIERDKSHTSYELLEYLGEKLDVSVDYLLETKEMQSKKLTDNMIIKSEIYIKSNQIEKAEQEIKEVLSICEKYNLIENYGKCNFLLATINLKKGNNNDAVTNFEKSLHFFIKNNDKESIFKCYLNIGKVYMDEKFYNGAISHFNFAEEVLRESKIEDISIYQDLYSKISYCYIKLDQPQKSLDYIAKISELNRQGNSKEEVDVLVLRANNMLNTGKYEEAREYFDKALAILEKEENKTELAVIYLTIADTYRKMGNTEKFLEYSQIAYDIKKNDEDDYMINSLCNMIRAYIELGEFEIARKYCKIGLASSIKSRNRYNEYRVLKFYADIYKAQNNYEVAIEYISKCIDIVEGLNDTKILADLYIELGELYSGSSKEKELEYYQKGVFMYKNLDII